jgi:hypothetical protein
MAVPMKSSSVAPGLLLPHYHGRRYETYMDRAGIAERGLDFELKAGKFVAWIGSRPNTYGELPTLVTRIEPSNGDCNPWGRWAAGVILASEFEASLTDRTDQTPPPAMAIYESARLDFSRAVDAIDKIMLLIPASTIPHRPEQIL